MSKKCFIIMPIADNEDYSTGHFKRVYEHIIKPACTKAGFTPVRADDVLNTNYIALDIIKKIIDSEMAICDLSSRNPNVFYELGIRQSFNLPVTLIRDSKTNRVFDIQGFRDIEYDSTLRIDNVQKTINVLAETLTNTYESKGQEINSLISLLGIKSATISSNLVITQETELILNSISGLSTRMLELEKQLTYTPPASAITQTMNGDWKDLGSKGWKQLKFGDFVEHLKFGKGKVLKIEGSDHNPVATIDFYDGEMKKIMLNYSKLKVLVPAE